MNIGSDHLHLRKRIYENLEPYPHPKRLQRFVDRLMYVVGTLAPLALLPQVFQIFVHRDVAGLSVWTWVLLGTINFLWALYGTLHREAPIVIANAGMALLDFLIVFGILFYR